MSMRFSLHTSLAMGCALLMAAPLAAQDGPIKVPTVEELAAFENMSNFNISPDGKYMTALEARGEDRSILIWETQDLKKPPKVLAAGKMKFSSVMFIKNDVLLVSLWQPYDLRGGGGQVIKTFAGKLMLVNADGKNFREAMVRPRARTAAEQAAQDRYSPQIFSSLPNDPDHILVQDGVGNNAGDIYKVNIRTMKAERFQRLDEGVAEYVADLDGNMRGRYRLDTDGTGPYTATELRNPQTGAWEEHFRSYAKERIVYDLLTFTVDPNKVLVISNKGSDRTAIYEYDIAKRQLSQPVFSHPFFDSGAPLINRYRNSSKLAFGEILAWTYQGPSGEDYEIISPELRKIDARIRAAFDMQDTPTKFVDIATGQYKMVPYHSDLQYKIIDYTPELDKIIFTVSGPAQPTIYYLMTPDKISILRESAPQIDNRSLGTSQFIYYKARDGLDIPAILTKPNPELCGKGPWRAVVHPHGGPWARDEIGYDRSQWIPLMSSRCMAVLQPQYRGSKGWGERLWKAGDREWGQKMQDDKDDGAKWMIEQKIAIADRIAMFGFSYGGYASMAAAVRPNGLYKCAIAGAGVSDIQKIWKQFYASTRSMQQQGNTVKGLSPVTKAAQIQIPIMVYHGERDQIVPIEQAQWYVNEARKSGQPVEYHVFDDYGHGNAWTRKIMADQLRIIDNYFAKGCGGNGL